MNLKPIAKRTYYSAALAAKQPLSALQPETARNRQLSDEEGGLLEVA